MKGTRVQSIIRELRGEKIDIVEYSDDPIAFVTNALSPAKVQRVSIVDDAERVMEVVVEDKQLSLAIGKKGQNVRLAAKLTGWRIDIKSEEEKRREVEAQFGELAGGDQAADSSTDLSTEAGESEVEAAKVEADSDASAKVEAAEGEATTVDASTEGVGPVDVESDVPVPYTLAGIGEKTVRKLVEGGFATLESLGGATAAQLSAIPGIGDKTAEKILAAARGDAPAEEPTNDV
jgi:transcription antitermination factor NusA-like protein